jgi:hypothetical protein
MGTIARVNKAGGGTDFNLGQLISPTEVNSDFNNAYAVINGGIDDANIETATIPGEKSLRFIGIADPGTPAGGSTLQFLQGNNPIGVTSFRTSTGAVRTSMYTLFTHTAVVGTDANTNEKTLATDTLPAGLLLQAGDRIRIRAVGDTSSSNATTGRLYFGASSLQPLGMSSATTFCWDFEVARITQTTQRAAGLAVFLGTPSPLSASPTADLANTVEVKVTGQNTSVATANLIVLRYLVIDFLPAPYTS